MPLSGFDPEKIMASPFLIGFAGAVVALRGAPGKTWLERVINATCGALMAGFMTAAIAEFFGLRTAEMQSAIAFCIGLFGMNLTAAVNDWIREAKLADVVPWIKKG